MNSGYSSTPQLKKLGLVLGTRFDLINAPEGWRFDEDPDASVRVHATASADVVIAFVSSARELDLILDAQAARIRPAGAIWIAWPRKAAGHVSDVSDNVVREIVLPRGLVDVKVAAIDTDWSGLKIVWRLENR